MSATTGADDCFKRYTIWQGGADVGTIDIPKDFLVKSGEIKTCTTQGIPVPEYMPGDKYLDFAINAAVSAVSSDEQHIYIKVTDLIDVYNGTDGDNAEIAIRIDDNNNISAVIKPRLYAEISSIASSYVENGINNLDIDDIDNVASMTISKITENDGIVSAEFTPILIEKTQVNGLMSELSGLNDKFQDYYTKS